MFVSRSDVMNRVIFYYIDASPEIYPIPLCKIIPESVKLSLFLSNIVDRTII